MGNKKNTSKRCLRNKGNMGGTMYQNPPPGQSPAQYGVSLSRSLNGLAHEAVPTR